MVQAHVTCRLGDAEGRECVFNSWVGCGNESGPESSLVVRHWEALEGMDMRGR
jgi:hypothetical protein